MNALASAPLVLLFALSASSSPDAADADWKLDVAVDPPRAITVQRPGSPSRVVWWSTLTLTNKTGRARSPVVVAKLVTDTDKTYVAGYDPVAAAAVQSAAGDATSLYEWKEPLEDGASKKLVVAFGDIDRFANYLDVRLSGVASALTRNRGEWFEQLVEHRTKFHRPGSENRTADHAVVPVGTGWVVVSKKKIR